MEKKVKKGKKPILYERYMADIEAKKEHAEIEEEIGQPVVVNKVSVFGRFLDLMGGMVSSILRLIWYALLFGLASIGLTVLCNTALREAFISAVMNTIK